MHCFGATVFVLYLLLFEAQLFQRMDVVMKQLKEYEGTFDLVTKEFASMVMVLAERLGEEPTLRMLKKAKERLERPHAEKGRKKP